MNDKKKLRRLHHLLRLNLFPVEKIEKTYEVSIIGNECEIAENGYEWKSICKSTSESKIDAVWQTVVKFIQNHV